MKYKGSLIAVRNMERSKKFYREVLGLHITADFGANVTLTGGIFLQTVETWYNFIEAETSFGANDAELYFEEDDFDVFAERLKSFSIDYVHEVKEHSWGQRAVRFYDPDFHIIEVGESLKNVALRFAKGGFSAAQIAERMEIPLKMVEKFLK